MLAIAFLATSSKKSASRWWIKTKVCTSFLKIWSHKTLQALNKWIIVGTSFLGYCLYQGVLLLLYFLFIVKFVFLHILWYLWCSLNILIYLAKPSICEKECRDLLSCFRTQSVKPIRVLYVYAVSIKAMWDLQKGASSSKENKFWNKRYIGSLILGY